MFYYPFSSHLFLLFKIFVCRTHSLCQTLKCVDNVVIYIYINLKFPPYKSIVEFYCILSQYFHKLTDSFRNLKYLWSLYSLYVLSYTHKMNSTRPLQMRLNVLTVPPFLLQNFLSGISLAESVIFAKQSFSFANLLHIHFYIHFLTFLYLVSRVPFVRIICANFHFFIENYVSLSLSFTQFSLLFGAPFLSITIIQSHRL